VLLYIADRSAQDRKLEDIGLPTALLVGAAQAIALMPGVSRSGITITAGRFLRLDRDSAARFSFFLLVPIVFGAVIYKGLKHIVFGTLPAGWEGPFLVGTVAAAGVGLIAIDLLLGYLRRHDYTVFVVYRLCLAAAILVLIATGVKDATF
jgi:undecaprenyl-diphosphatase